MLGIQSLPVLQEPPFQEKDELTETLHYELQKMLNKSR